MKNHRHVYSVVIIILCTVLITAFTACSRETAAGAPEAEPRESEESFPERTIAPMDIAVFVPGVVAGSPLYEQLVSGTERAAGEYDNITVKVVEGGFNQAEWTEKLTSLAATGAYEFIVTSNPAMPYAALEVLESFPEQKFINMDAYYTDNPQLYTVLYNQVEQGYLVGYLGGLVTKSSMEGANEDLKVGMIVAQEYPVLTKMIKPGYLSGAQGVDEDITLDYRVIGNWYDANKAADLANSMFDAGTDIILTIAGGAAQGAIKAAQARGKYILYFDAAEYDLAPGTILGCAVLNQDMATYETVKKGIEGTIQWGTAEVLNMRDGYVDFADEDPLYKESVPEDIRDAMAATIRQLRDGELIFPVPEL